jgi:probable HAF family extracellular repeat protein
MKSKPYQKLTNRSRLIAGLGSIGLVAFVTIGIATLRAQQTYGPQHTYSVTDLGVVSGMTASEPAAINNLGQVAGTSTAGAHGCAFRYYNNNMQDIGGIGSRGFGISQTGAVVGDFAQLEPSTPNHAALFRGGAPIDLGVLPGALFSRANAVNSNGYVVGYSGSEFDSDNSRAFVWTRSAGMLDLGTLGGPYAQAMALNDAGYATGNSSTALSIGARHAFLTQVWPGYGPAKPMRDLGTLGGTSSYGMAINMSNHVVGYSMLNINYDAVHAFLHNGGAMIDLGSLTPNVPGADYSVALGINNSDQIVGYSYVGNVGSGYVKQAAFVFGNTPEAGMVNLNDVISRATAAQYWLFAATAINDQGQIVACAYRGSDGLVHAVLLTPMGN